MTPRAWRGCRRLLAAACVLLVTGCSLSAQETPTAVRSPGEPVSAPGSGSSDIAMWVTVFLVQGNHLVAVRRTTAAAAGTAPVVAGLLEPVSSAESQRGLRTALPLATTRLKVAVTGNVARVWLPAGFDHLAVRDQVLAAGQIVFTLTGVPSVNGVQFTNGPRRIDVPDDRGRLVPGPVTRGDYALIAPE